MLVFECLSSSNSYPSERLFLECLSSFSSFLRHRMSVCDFPFCGIFAARFASSVLPDIIRLVASVSCTFMCSIFRRLAVSSSPNAHAFQPPTPTLPNPASILASKPRLHPRYYPHHPRSPLTAHLSPLLPTPLVAVPTLGNCSAACPVLAVNPASFLLCHLRSMSSSMFHSRHICRVRFGLFSVYALRLLFTRDCISHVP